MTYLNAIAATRPFTFGGAARPLRRDGATDRLTNDHRLPARHLAGFFVSGEISCPSSDLSKEVVRFEVRPSRTDVPVPNPLPKLLSGEDLTPEDAEHLFERLVLGRLEPAEIAGMLIATPHEGRDGRGNDRSRACLVRGRRAVRTAGLSLCRLLRYRRGRIGPDQCLHGNGFRRGGCGLADREARQPERQLALWFGGRPRGVWCTN